MVRQRQRFLAGPVAPVVVDVGETVAGSQEVAVIDCMKTELSVESPVEGVVKEVLVKEWDEMDVGAPMLVVGCPDQ